MSTALLTSTSRGGARRGELGDARLQENIRICSENGSNAACAFRRSWLRLHRLCARELDVLERKVGAIEAKNAGMRKLRWTHFHCRSGCSLEAERPPTHPVELHPLMWKSVTQSTSRSGESSAAPPATLFRPTTTSYHRRFHGRTGARR